MSYWKTKMVSRYTREEVALLCARAYRLTREGLGIREAFERLNALDVYNLLGEKRERRLPALAAIGELLENGYTLNEAVRKVAEMDFGYTERGLWMMLYALSAAEKERVDKVRKRMRNYLSQARHFLKKAEYYAYTVDERLRDTLRRMSDEILFIIEQT